MRIWIKWRIKWIALLRALLASIKNVRERHVCNLWGNIVIIFLLFSQPSFVLISTRDWREQFRLMHNLVELTSPSLTAIVFIIFYIVLSIADFRPEWLLLESCNGNREGRSLERFQSFPSKYFLRICVTLQDHSEIVKLSISLASFFYIDAVIVDKRTSLSDFGIYFEIFPYLHKYIKMQVNIKSYIFNFVQSMCDCTKYSDI